LHEIDELLLVLKSFHLCIFAADVDIALQVIVFVLENFSSKSFDFFIVYRSDGGRVDEGIENSSRESGFT
jgi:hypothetical protein